MKCKWLIIALFLNMLQACALSHAVENDHLLIAARLPIVLSGIHDARAEFAQKFDAELMSDAVWSKKGKAESFLFFDPKGVAQVNSAIVEYGKTAVLVVPGILGECFDNQALPFTDGEIRSRQTAYIESYSGLLDSLGLHSIEAIRVLGRAGSEENAKIIKKAILDKANNPEISEIIVLAYSKGTPDALESISNMDKTGELPSKLRALVSVAGVVMGTPIADSLENLYRIINKIIGSDVCGASDGKDIASLRTDVRSKWLAHSPMPGTVQMYSLVATTTKDNVGLGLRGFYTMLSFADVRNDGQMIMSDAILPRSTLLAVAKSDHWDFVLPLSSNPDIRIRGLASGKDFPRQALFRAVIRYVVEDISKK